MIIEYEVHGVGEVEVDDLDNLDELYMKILEDCYELEWHVVEEIEE